MKKVLTIIIAVSFVLGMAGMAAADDRLSLSGDLEVRAQTRTNDFYSDSDANDKDYVEQRLRLQMAIKPVDTVTVFFRADWDEGVWGIDTNDGGEPLYNATDDADRVIDLDKAYIQVKTDNYELEAGLQQMMYGLGYAYDVASNGVNATLTMLPVDINLSWYKVDEGGGTSDNEDLGTRDTDLYGLQVTYGNHRRGTAAGAYYAKRVDSETEDTQTVMALFGAVDLGPVRLKGEVESFGGDDGNGTDYVGSSLWVEASMNLTKALKLGAAVNYGTSADSDNNEQLIYTLMDANGGPHYAGGALAMPVMDAALLPKSPNAQYVWSRGPNSSNSGTVGGTIYANYMIIAPLKVGAQITYLTPHDKDETNDMQGGNIDSNTIVTLGVEYKLNKATTISLIHFNGTQSGDNDYETNTRTFLNFLVKF